MKKTYQITTPNWVAGIVVDEKGFVVETANINRWMLGKRLTMIRNWVMKNNFRFVEIEEK